MGKISEIFNFDNIGGKIKNLAKWSCWIMIILIWIAAPIAFIVLIADEYPTELYWIPLVSAAVGPVFVWLGSWVMYAFGEFVEDIHALRNKEGTTKEVSAKQDTEPKHFPAYMPQAATPAPKAESAVIPESPQKQEATTANHVESTFFEGYWICGKCKTKNLKTRNECWSCGNPM